MKNYLLITGLLLKDIFRRKEKKHIILFSVLAVLYLCLSAIGVLFMIYFTPVIMSGAKETELITTILFFDLIATIILGIITAISFLYLSKDNEFFLSLPIRPMSVFLSKLTIVYLSEVIISIAILLPLLITSGIVMNLPILFFFFIPVMILTVPIFALIIISLISMPIVFFITLFRNKGAVTSIVVISIFTFLMTLYFVFIFSTTGNIDESQVVDLTPLFDSLTRLSYAFYPMYMLVKFSTLSTAFSLSLGFSMLVEFSIFIGFLLLFIFLSFFFSLVFYNKINARVLENIGSTTGKKGEHKLNTPFKALIKKEFKEIVRNATVALQALSGVILCPLIIVVMSFSFSSMFNSVEEMPILIDYTVFLIWSMSIMMLLTFGVAVNVGANTCISREGDKFQFLKLIPIDYKTQIRAKHTLYIIIGGSSIITGSIGLIITTAILGIFIWWAMLMLFVSAVIWLYAMTSISIYLDLKNPRLDWKSVKEIIRRGKNSAVSIIWMFSMMLSSMALLFLSIYMPYLAFMLMAILLSVYIISGIVFAYIFHNLLYKNTEKLFIKTFK